MSLLRALLLFAFWVAFFGVGIWLLIRFFRNGSFLSGHRVWRRLVQALIVVLVVGLPWLALLILLIIEFSTRSPADPERTPPLIGPGEGGVGVREPRRPWPSGLSGAEALPLPSSDDDP